MPLGISTACFYPMNTEESLKSVAKIGADVTEVFFNAPTELDAAFLKTLSKIKEDAGIRIKSVHPFTSFAEGYILFSQCERRFMDYRDFYKRYYDAATYLGAQIVVFHGAHLPLGISDDLYFERMRLLTQDAASFGILLAQENVVHHIGQTPQLMHRLSSALQNDFNMVLDIKQAVRAGCSPRDFVNKFSHGICHVHLSDYGESGDCILPGEGVFDFAAFFSQMTKLGYAGDYVIELYRSGFRDADELARCFCRLKALL